MGNLYIGASILGGFTGILGILFAILVFGFVIFIHELGHFIAAKSAGVKVNEFSIGMGPAIIKRERKGTIYALRILPIGGYVAMEGEDEYGEYGSDENDGTIGFKEASIPRRAIIMTAGVIMNLILGFLIVLSVTLYQANQPKALFATTTVGGFHENSITNESLEVGDQIIKINGKKVSNYSDMTFQMSRDRDKYMDIVVVRDGEQYELDRVEFQRVEAAEGLFINVLDFYMVGEKPTFLGTIKLSFDRTKDFVRQIWVSVGDLVTGNVGINQLSGPIGITKQIGEVTKTGDWLYTLMFIALISLNLGVLNLIPLPVLDGGKLLFLLIEGVTGKPVNEKIELALTLVSFVLIFGLMIVVSFNDVLKLF